MADPRGRGRRRPGRRPGTGSALDGARHTILRGFHLGDAVDPEADGQPTSLAVGDDNDAHGDDEDGVVEQLLVRAAS